MPSYILSNANRFYAAVESSYGLAAPVMPTNRFPASRLRAQEVVEQGRRLDKTGTRTYLGASPSGRRHTAFEIRTYLSAWGSSAQPAYGPLFEAALGMAGKRIGDIAVETVVSPTTLRTVTPHQCRAGDAISFSGSVATGTMLKPTVTYRLSTSLPSLTIYDYWDPATMVSRLLTGASVDSLDISVNGDYHAFAFSGPAAQLLDPLSFQPGTAGLNSFPSEPLLGTMAYGGVPGHLGQAWLGDMPHQFFTLTEASIQLRNNIELRNQEFGSSFPRAIVPGRREVETSFSLFAQDDEQTLGLYAAAKRRTPIQVMLQLGQQQGELMAIYLPNTVLELPNFNDSETRLQWRFKSNVARGISDDELSIAFA